MNILERIKNAKPVDKEVLRQSIELMEKLMKAANLESRIKEARSRAYAEKTFITGI